MNLRGSNWTLGLFAINPISGISLPNKPIVVPSLGATE